MHFIDLTTKIKSSRHFDKLLRAHTAHHGYNYSYTLALPYLDEWAFLFRVSLSGVEELLIKCIFILRLTTLARVALYLFFARKR